MTGLCISFDQFFSRFWNQIFSRKDSKAPPSQPFFIQCAYSLCFFFDVLVSVNGDISVLPSVRQPDGLTSAAIVALPHSILVLAASLRLPGFRNQFHGFSSPT